MYTQNDILQMNIAVIQEIGLFVDNMGNLVDQDTWATLKCGGKNIKFISGQSVVPMGTVDCEFDLLNNFTLCEMIFGYFLSKEKELFGLNIITYYTIYENPVDGGKRRSAVVVKLTDGSEITSNYFYNKCLKYIDFILKYGGREIDLNFFEV